MNTPSTTALLLLPVACNIGDKDYSTDSLSDHVRYDHQPNTETVIEKFSPPVGGEQNTRVHPGVLDSSFCLKLQDIPPCVSAKLAQFAQQRASYLWLCSIFVLCDNRIPFFSAILRVYREQSQRIVAPDRPLVQGASSALIESLYFRLFN